MKYLVGYSGFVGSNLSDSKKFDGLYNSKNIEESFGKNPDLLVYSGVRAEKFLANKNPEEDKKEILKAFENIKKINADKVVLISTIDVYSKPFDVDENSEIKTDELSAYGFNRFLLEQLVRLSYPDSLIIRLPGLYGNNLKKNFIFDLINIIPSLLNEQAFSKLKTQDKTIENFYNRQENGFFKCVELNKDDKNILIEYYKKANFSTLNFTDSRASFQFYNLSYLWNHIELAVKNNIKTLNISTEPVSVRDILEVMKKDQFVNEITTNIPFYNYKTIYDNLFSGQNGYLFDKKFVLEDIKKFIEHYSEVN